MPKISQLPTLENITTGSIIPVVENSITQKLSVGKLFEFLSGALDETFATETELMLTASGGSFNTSSLVTTSSFNSHSSSVNNTTQSLNNSTQSLNTFSASVILTGSIINTFSSSVNTTTASLNSYTSSNDGKWNTLGGQTGSFVTEAETSSFVTNVSMFLSKSAFDTYTGSAATAVSSAINSATSSFAFTSSVTQQVSTSISSQNIQHNVLFIDTTGPGFIQVDGGLRYNPNTNLLTTTASLALTASFAENVPSNFATTGSNQFNGNQTITGSVDLTGFPLTASFIRLNGGNGASNEDNFHQIRFDYRYDSGSRALGAGGFSHFLTSRHFPGANSNNNALDVYLNNSVGQYSSTAWNSGSTLGVTITATGIGILKTNPNTALDVSGNLLVTGSIISTTSPIISSSIQINNFGFATTGSNQFNGNQTITGSLVHGNAGNIATGEKSHAEGEGTQAIGNFSHAEGLGTIAYGNFSHAEGQDTIASGSHSHAEGKETIALADHQHVQGKYNITSSVPAAFIVGNGTDAENRSNLIHAAGNQVQITGSLSVSGSLMISGSGSLNGSNIVSSNTIQKIETISSASYAALTPPVSGTLYIII